MDENGFWSSLDRLVEEHPIEIDRPRNSHHPIHHDMVYPLDYGYLVGTISMDGGGLDVWLGASGDKRVVGIICTIDLIRRDIETKILIGCTEDEIQTIMAFISQNNMGCQLIRREQNSSEKR